jgi:hypothetical protein
MGSVHTNGEGGGACRPARAFSYLACSMVYSSPEPSPAFSKMKDTPLTMVAISSSFTTVTPNLSVSNRSNLGRTMTHRGRLGSRARHRVQSDQAVGPAVWKERESIWRRGLQYDSGARGQGCTATKWGCGRD